MQNPSDFREAPGPSALEATGKPKLRGVLHLVAFFVALAAGPILVAVSEPARRGGAAIYALSLAALLGTSAAYHRGNWGPRARRRMARLDHSMIYILIAGTYTPIAGGLPGEEPLLAIIWTAAALGIAFNFLPWRLPGRLLVIPYLAMGWLGVVSLPKIGREAGLVVLGLAVAGGILYTVGALAYARRHPDPLPDVFGYHEVFHALVVLAAICHFAAVTITVT